VVVTELLVHLPRLQATPLRVTTLHLAQFILLHLFKLLVVGYQKVVILLQHSITWLSSHLFLQVEKLHSDLLLLHGYLFRVHLSLLSLCLGYLLLLLLSLSVGSLLICCHLLLLFYLLRRS